MIVPVVRGSVVSIRAADDREGVEVSMLKVLDDRRLHLGVLCHRARSAVVVGVSSYKYMSLVSHIEPASFYGRAIHHKVLYIMLIMLHRVATRKFSIVLLQSIYGATKARQVRLAYVTANTEYTAECL